MSKALNIVGYLVLLFGVAGFAIDLLPVDAFQPSSNDFYLKIEPTDESSFDGAKFRLPALVVGTILVVIGKFIGGKN
ncbi:hypothetical protein [Shewanella algae]|uniref:hypothetical protein n=1 Tax=Shewanella TaxID=22 RepID=UPI0031F4FDEE